MAHNSGGIEWYLHDYMKGHYNIADCCCKGRYVGILHVCSANDAFGFGLAYGSASEY